MSELIKKTSPTRRPESIEAIDDELASHFRMLRFRPELETAYQVDTAPTRRRVILIATVIGLVLYDSFLINDWRMIPDIFLYALIGRLLIFSPVAIAGIFILRSRLRLVFVELIASFVAVLAVVVFMGLFDLSESPHRITYHYGGIIVMIFAVLVQRIQAPYCIFAIIGILAAQIIGLFFSNAVDTTTFQADCFFYATMAMLVLFSAYILEHEGRKSYLLSVRSRLMNDQLERAANVDPLTDLWNRRYLNAAMAQAWKEAETTPCPMAVILLDIDHFKMFNDTYGHPAGDDCLRRIGARLREGLALYGDVAVRFGGEEFMIFLANISPAAAREAAAAIHQTIRDEAVPYPKLGTGAIVTASIGVATGQAPLVSASALMKQADVALYDAKHAGRDCIAAFAVDACALTIAAA